MITLLTLMVIKGWKVIKVNVIMIVITKKIK